MTCSTAALNNKIMQVFNPKNLKVHDDTQSNGIHCEGIKIFSP